MYIINSSLTVKKKKTDTTPSTQLRKPPLHTPYSHLEQQSQLTSPKSTTQHVFVFISRFLPHRSCLQ